MKVIFMGTPEFAVPSLKILVDNKVDIVAVITAPDKPAGRGKKLQMSPIKQYALKQGLKILQPEKLKAPEFIEQLKSYEADLQIVVAFRMLPEQVWSMPPKGTFNLHASLLPQYRGAAPIHWAIMNGESETGVTTFFLKHEIDTGNIIFQEKEEISEWDTVGTVYERLMHKGAELVLKTLKAIESGTAPQNQQKGSVSHAPKIFKPMCEINWEQSAENVYNFIRGLSPFPAAWATLNHKHCKIYKASLPHHWDAQLKEIIFNHVSIPVATGAYFTDNKQFLCYRAQDGILAVEDLQMEGRKRMDIREFLKGTQL